MNIDKIALPGEVFNYAQHLLQLNRERSDKTAYIDDQGKLSFGELDAGCRSLGAALLAAGIRREERVLLLMHDCNDWPLSFLGAIYAGIVPVAVNTLLTADDYLYMLQHSRARAALVSDALLPILREAMSIGEHEVATVFVSRPSAEPADGAQSLEACLQTPALQQAAATSRDEAAFWLYSSGSTGKPKGTVHSHANPYWTTELYAKGVMGITEQDLCFSAAKLFFAYGLGNALTFPLTVGATSLLFGGRPTPRVIFERLIEHQPTIFFGAPTGYAGMLAAPDPPATDQLALRLAVSAGEALPANLAQRFTDHFGVDVIDGIGSTEMLHIYISNQPGKLQYGSSAGRYPAMKSSCAAMTGSRWPTARSGIYTSRARAPRSCTGTSATKPAIPSRANGPRAVISICATQTAAIPVPAAATTCCGLAACTSLRSRSNPRWRSTRRCWKPRSSVRKTQRV